MKNFIGRAITKMCATIIIAFRKLSNTFLGGYLLGYNKELNGITYQSTWGRGDYYSNNTEFVLVKKWVRNIKRRDN